MSQNRIKEFPSGSLSLALSSRTNLPAPRFPDVKEPFPGRRGRQLANETREKYFLIWHKMILERLGIESAAALSIYAQQIIDQAVNQMLDRFYNTVRLPEANEFLKEFTEGCMQLMAANIRTLLENHSRMMGDFV